MIKKILYGIGIILILLLLFITSQKSFEISISSETINSFAGWTAILIPFLLMYSKSIIIGFLVFCIILISVILFIMHKKEKKIIKEPEPMIYDPEINEAISKVVGIDNKFNSLAQETSDKHEELIYVYKYLNQNLSKFYNTYKKLEQIERRLR